MRPLPGTTNRVQVLVISPEQRDCHTLSQIFDHTSWSLDRAETISSTAEHLATQDYPVILCDEFLPDGDWKDVYALAQTMTIPAHVIVLSRAADDRFWADVLNTGGYDVLAKPLRAEEVLHAIGAAWRHWMDRRRMQNATAGIDTRNTAAVA